MNHEPIRLRSDFIDWYDGAFSNAYGRPFLRLARNDTPRQQLMAMISMEGYRVPRYGLVRQMDVGIDDPPDKVVVHTDPYAHCGEGKVLLPLTDARLAHSTAFSVEYIDPQIVGFSTRWLRVGRREFMLAYDNDGRDWRSNCADPRVSVLFELSDRDKIPRWPSFHLVAVDFVIGHDGRRYAIDLNTAPGLSPLKGFMSADEIVSEIASVFP